MYTMQTKEQLISLRDEIIAKATQITQRSPAWGLARISTIGGSKIATFLGIGYNTMREMLEDILIPKTGTLEEEAEKKIAMNWGTVFEDPLCQYISTKYDCEIVGTETFFIGSGKYTGLSYSPDGIAIMRVPKKIGEEERETSFGIEIVDIIEYVDQIVLLEYKCPYKRFLRGYIPDYYRPQPLMGMEMLGIQKALFVEAVIRPCALADMDGSTTYAKIFDTRNYKKMIASGVFGVFGIKTTTEPIDMGYLSPQVFNLIIHRMAIGEWQYEPRQEGKEYSHLLGWKILDIGEHWIDSQPGFLEPLMPAVGHVLRFIHDMQGQSPEVIKMCIDSFQLD